MEIILVGFGGVFGAVVRYSLGKVIAARTRHDFPVATLVINITGALLLGLVSGIGADRNSYLLMGDGFLGAYTTFSTFMYEGFNLFKGNKKRNATVYIAGSLVIGVIGFIIGYQLGKLMSL